jgi:hypothetical protein
MTFHLAGTIADVLRPALGSEPRTKANGEYIAAA